MEEEKLELLECFKRLCPNNRVAVMAIVSTALAAEEVARKQYGLDKEPPKQAVKTA